LNKKNDTRLLAIVTLFWFAQYVFVPYLSPHLAALGIGASFAGTILGMYGMAQLILRIPISVGEDCVGHDRIFMGAGLVTLGIGGALPLFSDAPVVYLLSRLLTGVGASTWVSFTASFTRGYENAKSRMGQLIAANNLGVLISYVLGGVVYQMAGIKPLFALSACVTVISLVLLPGVQVTPVSGDRRFSLKAIFKTLLNKHLLICSFLCALMQLIAFATTQSFVNNYAQTLGVSGFGLSLVAIAFYVAGVAASSAFAKGVFSRMTERAFLAMAFGVIALYCAVLPLCRSMIMIVFAQLLGGVGRTLVYTHLMAVCSAEAKPEQKTTAMGIFQSLYSVGMTLGPIVMGNILDANGSSYEISFLWMALFAVAGIVLSVVLWPKNRK